MTTEYTKEDELQTLRIWYDAKPFTKEIETSIRALAQMVFSDDIVEGYIQERLESNNGEYDKPSQTLDELAFGNDTEESVQEEKAEIQDVGEAIEADACYWDGWNP